jgi:hypothetical protein
MMPNRQPIAILVCALALGCADSKTKHDNPDSGAGAGGSAAIGGAGGAGSNAGSGGNAGNAGSGGVGNTESLCGGAACGVDEICCLLNAQCFNPHIRVDFCSVPNDTPPDPNGRQQCASNADCAATEMCTGRSCTGVGTCTARDNCGSCSGPNGPCVVCGCDGVSYVGIGAACAAGVRVASSRAGCGEMQTLGGGGSGGAIVTITYCGTDAQCPSGQQCCTRSGECFDPEKPALCDPPPAGTSRGCYSDADCYDGICVGVGCEGPGGCHSVGGSCPSVLAPVCGCDGQTYTNAECAMSEGIRIASVGECL